MENNKGKRFLLLAAAALPFVIGVIGYRNVGFSFTDSMYASLSLYFLEQAEGYNIFIEIARWLAPLVTATTFLYAIKSVFVRIKYRLYFLGKKDTVAVYSDMDIHIRFDAATRAIYPGEDFKSFAKSHIILFSTDEKSLKFYENHKGEMRADKAYLGIRSIESGLLKTTENVNVFEIYSVIARFLWKDIAIWNRAKEEINIVVFGSGKLACDILSTGLLLNLFSLNQKITYYLIGDNSLFIRRHHNLKTMNGDRIVFFNRDEDAAWEVIKQSDLAIVADEEDIELIETIAINAAQAPVYFYSKGNENLLDHIFLANLKPFGKEEDVYTDENIRSEKLIRKAKLFNKHYAELYNKEAKWEKLSGFLKSSNISSADYGEVLSELNERIDLEEQARLEHIRWCRFHFLNYYSYGIPESGNSDEKKRIHRALVKFDELPIKEQDKDREVIKITKGL